MSEADWKPLGGQVRDIWNRNAPFWDEAMKEGNSFNNQLVVPSTQRLLELKPGEWVLDIACGNGNFSRRLAQWGAHVVAFDFSEAFIERARARTVEFADRIDYRVIDASRGEDLLALGERRFDAAVCNMALMDMAQIDPLLESLARLLKPGGRFVFSVTHPCFNNLGSVKVMEEEDREGEIVTRYGVKVFGYITPKAGKGLGMIGQPQPQYYFERPLSVLLQHGFRAGFVLDGLEEPAFDVQNQAKRPLSWENFSEIPPALVARLRLPL
jgi:ubiquinone/menaquinone biosynthesis C-methylase UbiE